MTRPTALILADEPWATSGQSYALCVRDCTPWRNIRREGVAA